MDVTFEQKLANMMTLYEDRMAHRKEINARRFASTGKTDEEIIDQVRQNFLRGTATQLDHELICDLDTSDLWRSHDWFGPIAGAAALDDWLIQFVQSEILGEDYGVAPRQRGAEKQIRRQKQKVTA